MGKQDSTATAESPELQGVYAGTDGKGGEEASGEEESTEVEAGAEAEGGDEEVEEGQEQEAKGEESEEEEGEEAEGPPDTYEWNLPEGMELDDIGAAEFEPIAREWGLSQKQLNSAVEFYVGRMQQTVESVVDAMRTQAEEQSEADRKAATKLLGKDGARDVARAIERFGGDSFRKAADEKGWGNDPELASLLQRVGAAIAEDTLEVGQGAGKRQTSDDGQERGIYA